MTDDDFDLLLDAYAEDLAAGRHRIASHWYTISCPLPNGASVSRTYDLKSGQVIASGMSTAWSPWSLAACIGLEKPN